MNNQQPAIIVVTGIMAAGKSTIAHLLAQRFQRGIHIEADMLQRMIVAGGISVFNTIASNSLQDRWGWV